MPFQIKAQKATKTQLKARVAIDGPSGSGKTWTALVVATALAGENGRIVVVDTERRSASLYANKFTFDTVNLPLTDERGNEDPRGFSPEVYTEVIEALENDYDVIVIDSTSHAWEGKGGALELVDQAAAKSKGNSYVAWRTVTPKHNKMVDAMLQAKCHIVVTMRSKMDYVQEKDNSGRTSIRKVGMAPIQRAGMEYEFTMIGDMDLDHRIIVTKSRCDIMADRQELKPGAEFFRPFVEWLNDGDAVPVIAPQPAARPEVEMVPGTQVPASEIDPKHTWANLLKHAQQQYKIGEEEVKAALKEALAAANKPLQYTPEEHVALVAIIDQKYRTVEPEVEPDYLKE
jgi:energy-coupling factor transporter ATP-binding protein EcfA2